MECNSPSTRSEISHKLGSLTFETGQASSQPHHGFRKPSKPKSLFNFPFNSLRWVFFRTQVACFCILAVICVFPNAAPTENSFADTTSDIPGKFGPLKGIALVRTRRHSGRKIAAILADAGIKIHPIPLCLPPGHPYVHLAKQALKLGAEAELYGEPTPRPIPFAFVPGQPRPNHY